jgi:hypothetical protein
MKEPILPQEMEAHIADYRCGAWTQYTMQELGMWVHLLCARAKHRDNPDKRAKDLYDAQNYLHAMQAKLDALKG